MSEKRNNVTNPMFSTLISAAKNKIKNVKK
jgi:hypothetical protein